MGQVMDEKIEALLSKWKDQPFEYGSFDCCQFAADAVRSLHGLEVKITPYKTEREAIRVLRDMGGLIDALGNAGLSEQPYPMRGDVILVKHPGVFQNALAIFTGLGAHMPTNLGLWTIPKEDWVSVWGVR
jgi:hypothetical protein